MLYAGLFLMMKGLLKKAVVADYLAQFNNLVFDNPAGYGGTGFARAAGLQRADIS